MRLLCAHVPRQCHLQHPLRGTHKEGVMAPVPMPSGPRSPKWPTGALWRAVLVPRSREPTLSLLVFLHSCFLIKTADSLNSRRIARRVAGAAVEVVIPPPCKRGHQEDDALHGRYCTVFRGRMVGAPVHPALRFRLTTGSVEWQPFAENVDGAALINHGDSTTNDIIIGYESPTRTDQRFEKCF